MFTESVHSDYSIWRQLEKSSDLTGTCSHSKHYAVVIANPEECSYPSRTQRPVWRAIHYLCWCSWLISLFCQIRSKLLPLTTIQTSKGCQVPASFHSTIHVSSGHCGSLSVIHSQYAFWNTGVQHAMALKKTAAQTQKENVSQYDIFSLIFNLLYFVCFHCSHKPNYELFPVHFGDIEKHLSVKLSPILFFHTKTRLHAHICISLSHQCGHNKIQYTKSPHLPHAW